MWSTEPSDHLSRSVFRWGTSLIVVGAITAIVLTTISVDYRVTRATVPVLSASVANGATDTALNASFTIDSSVALNAAEVSGGWFSRTSGVAAHLRAIHCTDANTCWTADSDNQVRKTTNGGRTWSTQQSHVPAPMFGGTETLKDVFFVSATTGFSVGSQETCVLDFCGADRPTFLRSTDGGGTWQELAQINLDLNLGAASGNWGEAVFFTNVNTGWIVGSTTGADEQVVYSTTDGGTTWTANTFLLGASLKDISCSSATACIIVGNSGIIATSTNGVASVTSRTSGTANNLLALHCWSSTKCLTVGASGTILLTTNGGTSWSAQTSGTSSTLRGVYCTGAAPECWVVGDSGTVLYTADGDASSVTWSSKTSGTSNPLNSVYGTSNGRVWAVGNSGTIIQYGGVLLQTNTENVQAGAPTGANLCTSVTLGADGSGNANRRITCAHANLTASTWYTLSVTTAVRDATGDTIASTFTRAFQTAGPPGLSSAGVADAATAQTGTVTLTYDFDRALATGTVSTSTVTLQTNTGNTQAGAPTGANLCTSVTLGNDGSGNANRRITCAHAALSAQTWYTVTIIGGTDGVQSSAGTTMSANIVRTLRTDASPSISTVSVTDGEVGKVTTADLSVDFDNVIASDSVSTSTVVLREHGTNRLSGSASGSNSCGSVSLGSDGSGNSNRRAACVHGGLQRGKWYTMSILGGSGGIQSSGAFNLSGTITRRFKTAYGSGDRETVTASELANMITEGWFSRTGDAAATTKLTAAPELATTVSLSTGTASVTVPQNAEITKQGGGTFDSTAFTASDATTTVQNVPGGSPRAAVSYGVPNVPLTASAPITMSIPVDASLNGTTLEVYRSPDTDFSDNTTPATTCLVANATCTFTTTGLSFYAIVPPVSPAARTCAVAGDCGKP